MSAAIDEISDGRNLECAEYVLRTQRLLDHESFIQKHSDSRLIFHIAGYVARKSLKKFHALNVLLRFVSCLYRQRAMKMHPERVNLTMLD